MKLASQSFPSITSRFLDSPEETEALSCIRSAKENCKKTIKGKGVIFVECIPPLVSLNNIGT